MRRASVILAGVMNAFKRAKADGVGVRSAALDAERVAYSLGAQDFRILASARNGGLPLPLFDSTDIAVDPLLARVAIRFAGYWAEGLVTVSAFRDGTLRKAESALAAMIGKARPGIESSDLARIASDHLAPYHAHPFIAKSIGNAVGLSLEEQPVLQAAPSVILEENNIYTLRTGAIAAQDKGAILSAMVAVNADGAEVLWSAMDPSITEPLGAQFS